MMPPPERTRSSALTVHRDVTIPMRDGVKLRADVWLPGEGQYATLLQRTPYDKLDPVGSQHFSQIHTLRALDAGFAVVVQDTRGRGASSGPFEPFIHEADDGVDTVEWLRRQPFSNGRVATYGASYVGATQLLLALAGHDGPDAMAPFLTSGDYSDNWTYRGGALQLGFVLWWVADTLAPADMARRGLRPEDPTRRKLEQMRADPDSLLEDLPILSSQLIDIAPYVKDWLALGPSSIYWRNIAVLDRITHITAPALHITGFNDLFLEGSLALYSALRDQGSTETVRDGQYLIIGPWTHANLGEWQGRTWHGTGASATALDLTLAQLDFFSAILAGQKPKRPRVTYFTSGTNVWRTSETWPPPHERRTLYLQAQATLSWTSPGRAGSDSFVSDTLDPVPTIGGATFLPGLLSNENAGPLDQAALQARDDILHYFSGRLERDLELTGSLELKLWAKSSADDCDWTARVVDIHPSNKSYGICDGIQRARYRNGPTAHPLTPGVEELFTVQLGQISHVFRAGHRIGLQLASSNFPRFDRNPQCMVDPVTARRDDFRVAQQTVLLGGQTPSRLILR